VLNVSQLLVLQASVSKKELNTALKVGLEGRQKTSDTMLIENAARAYEA